MVLIDWRSYLLSALARRLGFAKQHIGMNSATGDRAFLFGSTEAATRELALNLAVYDALQRDQSDALKALGADLNRELGIH